MRWLASTVVLAACYAPTLPGGAPCSSQQDCPDGLSCLPTPAGDRCLAGPGGNPSIDGPTADNDGPPQDAPDGCVVLLDGKTSFSQQGWELQRAGSSTFTVDSSGTLLTTTGGASRQLLVKRGALPTTGPWVLDFEVQVVSAGGHNNGNASFAIMSSFHDPVGTDQDRKRMVYLDADAVGWGDAGLTVGLDTTVVRTYRLELNSSGSLRFSTAGTSIGGGSFQTNGDIALGDQTTSPGFDSSVRIISVKRGCP